MGRPADIYQRRVDPDKFRQYLQWRRIGMEELSEIVGVHGSTIRRMLETRKVGFELAVRICVGLDVDADTVFGPDNSPEFLKLQAARRRYSL